MYQHFVLQLEKRLAMQLKTIDYLLCEVIRGTLEALIGSYIPHFDRFRKTTGQVSDVTETLKF
jgi:hypothetical protein